MKVILLILAGLNALTFHCTVYRASASGTWPKTCRAGPAGRYGSLVFWAGIIVFGRMIAYNWYDCDRPQPRSSCGPRAARPTAAKGIVLMNLLPFFQWCEASSSAPRSANRHGRLQ